MESFRSVSTLKLMSSWYVQLHRRGFTLIELLLVMGIIAILASITIVAINPTKQLSASKDTARLSDAKQIQNAISQYLIATSALPTGVPTTGGAAKMICKEGVVADTTCINLDVLAPTYIAKIPRDSEEANANYTGYKVSSLNDRPMVFPVNLSNTITNGLISHWKFNEGTGTAVADASGANHPATLIGTEAADWSSESPAKSRSKGSFDFNQSDDVAIVTNETPLGSTWSISVWFKMPLVNFGNYHTLVRGSSIDHQVLVDPNFILGSYNQSIGFFSAGFNLSTLSNGWHHMTALGYSNVTVFYINGSLVGTAANQSTAGPGVYGLGNYQGGTQQWGQISDMRVYNRVLTPTEIQQIYGGNG